MTSKYCDYISICLIGASAPIAIDYYHHVLFGSVVCDSAGILEYITVASLFVLAILFVSPIYSFVIRCIYRIRHHHRQIDAPSLILIAGDNMSDPAMCIKMSESQKKELTNCEITNKIQIEELVIQFIQARIGQLCNLALRTSPYNGWNRNYIKDTMPLLEDNTTDIIDNPAEITSIVSKPKTDASNIELKKKSLFTQVYVSRMYEAQPVYDIIKTVLLKTKKPSPTYSARVFYVAWEMKLLNQSMGYIDAYSYFGTCVGKSKTSYSMEWTCLTTNIQSKKRTENKKDIKGFIDDELKLLNDHSTNQQLK